MISVYIRRILILLLAGMTLNVFSADNEGAAKQSTESSEDVEAEVPDIGIDSFEAGVQYFKNGDLDKAAQAFMEVAAESDVERAAIGAFNYGTVRALQAQKSSNNEEKRESLISSIEFLKRSILLNTLPDLQERQARQNLELATERLFKLPPPDTEDETPQSDQQQEGQEGQEASGQQQNSQQGSQQNQQASDGQSQSGQSQGGESRDGQSGQSQNNQGRDPQSLLNRQRDLSRQTEQSFGGGSSLANQQAELEQESRQAAQENPELAELLEEAAEKQSQAAEALARKDSDTAEEYQDQAEQALMQAVNQQIQNNKQLNDILAQEAERQAAQEAERNRLDQRGGVTDADKNW